MLRLTQYSIYTMACLLLLVVVTSANARELPIVTGEHWTTASEREKKSFLIGMGTIIEAEQELQGANPSAEVRDQSLIPDLVEGLSKYTITTAMEAIDAYYADNTDQLGRPVLEVIWFELTMPNVAAR